mgnify:CR=1 FL=1
MFLLLAEAAGVFQPQGLQPQPQVLELPQPQVRRQLQRQQLQPQVEPVEVFVAVVLTPATAAVVVVVELPLLLLRQQGLQQDCPTKFGKMIPPYTLQELHIAEKPPKKDVTELDAP